MFYKGYDTRLYINIDRVQSMIINFSPDKYLLVQANGCIKI